MKKEEVPQDESCFSNTTMKEVVYAVDKEGNYNKALSSGWEAKTIVLDKSLELLEERLKDTIINIKNGKQSPIAYYMELHRMDIPTLASYVEMWQWRVKRHLKSKQFKKLNEKTLKKYAAVFEITLTDLKNPKF